ncbi:MAG: BACON domain-containing protein [Bacteroidales bacterium]|nr:BACON domain-containing protein [Bacteroidales bacterium]
MKRLVLMVLLLGCWQASGQEYLKMANDCFDKGDYECAKRNYELYQFLESVDVSAQIQKSERCINALREANNFFGRRMYEAARNQYKIVLDNNPKDAYAKRQYDECVKQLTPAITLAVAPREISFAPEGGVASLAVATNANSYQVTSLPGWCSIENRSPQNFSIKCDLWGGSSPREGFFYVQAGDKSERINVIQSGAFTLTLSSGNLAFSSSGGTASVTVTTNANDYDIGSLPSWCLVVNKDADAFDIQCIPWSGASPREGYFDVLAGDKSERVTIVQTATIVFTVTPDRISFASTGGTVPLSVTTNFDDYEIASLPNWCSVAGKDAKGFSITCNPLPGSSLRESYFIVRAGEMTKTVMVTQHAPTTFSISPQNALFASSGGRESFTVSTNAADWQVTSLPSWCTVVDKKAEGFVIVCDPWSGSSPRQGFFDVQAGDKSERVTVSQSPATQLSVAPNEYAFTSSGGTWFFAVSTNFSNYDITSLPTWCAITDMSANGFVVVCDPWDGNLPREGHFYVHADDKSQIVKVIQSPRPRSSTRLLFGIDFGVGAPKGSDWGSSIDGAVRWTLLTSPYFGLDLVNLKVHGLIKGGDFFENALLQGMTGIRIFTPALTKEVKLFVSLKGGWGYQQSSKGQGFGYELEAGLYLAKALSIGFVYNAQNLKGELDDSKFDIDGSYTSVRIGLHF